MSFAARIFTFGAPVSNLAMSTFQILGLVGSTHTLSLTLNTDGTFTKASTGNGTSTYLGPTEWYTPPASGVGNSYWVKFHISSGSAWDAGLVDGTIYALSSARTVTWTSLTTQLKSGVLALTVYADAGGSITVGSGNVNFDCESIN